MSFHRCPKLIKTFLLRLSQRMINQLWDYSPPSLSSCSIFITIQSGCDLSYARRRACLTCTSCSAFVYLAGPLLWSSSCVSLCEWISFIQCDFCKVIFNLEGNHRELLWDYGRLLSNGSCLWCNNVRPKKKRPVVLCFQNLVMPRSLDFHLCNISFSDFIPK